MECEIDRWIGAASVLLQSVPVCCGEGGADLQGEALRLPSIYVPTLTYGLKHCVVSERMRSWLQVIKMITVFR